MYESGEERIEWIEWGVAIEIFFLIYLLFVLFLKVFNFHVSPRLP